LYLLALCAAAPLLDAAAADPKGPSLADYKAKEAEKAKNASAAAANEGKMAAVNKVTDMMENLQHQVLEEGEKEAATYDKFACFCKKMTNEKTKAIAKGKTAKGDLEASIKKLSTERDNLDKKIDGLNADIKSAEKAMAKLQATSDEALALYEKNEADLSAAIYGVTEAIKVLKSSKAPSLVQVQRQPGKRPLSQHGRRPQL